MADPTSRHMDALRAESRQIVHLEDAARAARRVRDNRILTLLGLGVPERKIAAAAGIAPSRINQIKAAAWQAQMGAPR